VVVPTPILLLQMGLPNMNNMKSSSRKMTPWSLNDAATPLQRFIDSVNQRNYDNRHPSLVSSGETEFINSYEQKSCRHCGSAKIRKFGKTGNGIIRYRCNDCGKTFTPITNTIFDNHKVAITEWMDFLLSIFGYGSMNLVSKNNRNAYNTTKYWMDKVFLITRGCQDDIVLKGNVWIDESYYSVRSDQIKRKSDGLKPRGTSRNQYCIAVACDEDHVFMKIEGFGSPSKKQTSTVYYNHIEEGSHLIHDTGWTHQTIIDQYHLSDEVYNAAEIKRLPDKDNPMNPVNQTCNLMKKFLNAHSGFLREDLQDYLDLLAFIINPPASKHKKLEIFMNRAMTLRVLHRYR